MKTYRNKEVNVYRNTDTLWSEMVKIIQGDKVVSFMMTEHDEPITFGKCLDLIGFDEKEVVLVIAEGFRSGKIYRYNNFSDNLWYEVGRMVGFA